MRSSLDKWYQVEELFLYNVTTTVIMESRVSFSDQDLFNLCMVNKDFANIVPKTCQLVTLGLYSSTRTTLRIQRPRGYQ